MKLYYFCSDFYPSGTGFAVSFTNFIQYLLDTDKYEHVFLFTTNDKAILPECFQHKVSLIKFNSRGELKLARVFKSTKILDFYSLVKYRHISKIIDSEWNSPNDIFFYEEFYFGNLKKYLKKKFPTNQHVVRVHGTMPEFVTFDGNNKFRRILFQQAFNDKDKINIATTTSFYIKFINKYLFDGQYDKLGNVNYIFLPNSIHPEFNRISPPKIKENKNALTLLQLGRMDRGGYFQKGFDDTLKALKYLESKKCLINRIKLVTIGSGSEKNIFLQQTKNLKQIKSDHYDNLKNEQVRQLIIEADVILLPSRCEGMSMFAVEAIALGKPIITTNNTGVDDICIEGLNSFKFDMYNYIDYAQIIQKIDQSPNVLNEMGIQSLKISELNSNKLIANIESFL